MKSSTRRLAGAMPLVLVLAAAPVGAEFEITQGTIAGGGTIEAAGANWTLSGTIGQWEASEASALSGGPWRMTGGFWGPGPEETGEVIFQDRFQSFVPSPWLAEPVDWIVLSET